MVMKEADRLSFLSVIPSAVPHHNMSCSLATWWSNNMWCPNVFKNF